MRVLLAVVAVGLLAGQAVAVEVRLSPASLVLRRSDVPPGYLLDRDNTTATQFDPAQPGTSRIVKSSGLLSGYQAKYRNTAPPRWRDISSLVYLFRHASGAAVYLTWLRGRIEHQQGPTFRRSRLGLGDEAWAYTTTMDSGTLVLWRYRRVVSLVACEEMTRHRALAEALARKQQRRLAGVLG